MYNEGYGAWFVSVYVYASVCYYVFRHCYAERCNTIVIPTIFCCNDLIFDFSKTASLGTKPSKWTNMQQKYASC